MAAVTHDGKRWSNADQDRIEPLAPYDPAWPAQYETEARAIRAELAARHPRDRDAYTDGKARYVDDIVRRAGTP